MKMITGKNNNIFLMILIFFISIGFAYLTTNMNIFGNTLLKGQKFDIHFENVQVSNEGVQIDTPQITDNRTTVKYDIILDKPGDFVEFTVDAKNDGTIDAMIKTITPLTLYDNGTKLDEVPSYLDYSVTYVDGTELMEKQLLKAGKKEIYKVHVEYKKDINKNDLVKTKKTLTAEFDVEYVQADDSTISKDQHQTTESTLDKTRFQNFGKNNNPTQLIFVNTGVNDSDDSKYTDISVEQDGSILAWMDETTMYVSAKEVGLYIKAPENSSYLIGDSSSFGNIEKIDVSKLDTSVVTNMSGMFSLAGYYVNDFEIIGLDEWETGNVTNMSYMFEQTGYKTPTFEMDLSGWDVHNVTNMQEMFYYTGRNSTTFKLDLSGWNAISVKNMSKMFYWTGYSASTFNINVTDWNTSSVTDMSSMFTYAGYSATDWSIGDLSNWKTGNVTSVSGMFYEAGHNAIKFELDLSGWDTSSVTSMMNMFYYAGYSAAEWNIGDISKWNTSKVISMSSMFYYAGYSAAEWNIGDISSWDTSSVSNMMKMFNNAGYSAEYTLDLSGWNVDKITSAWYYSSFNSGVEDKITPPKWIK